MAKKRVRRKVSDAEFRFILLEERDKLLRTLEEDDKRPVTIYDINCGWCEDYAMDVEERVQGATAYWLPDTLENVCHCVVKYRKRYYDAECIDGVEEFIQLPCVLNMKRSRDKVLVDLRRVQEILAWFPLFNASRAFDRYHVAVASADSPHQGYAACNRSLKLPPNKLCRLPGKNLCGRCLTRINGLDGGHRIRESLKEATVQ